MSSRSTTALLVSGLAVEYADKMGTSRERSLTACNYWQAGQVLYEKRLSTTKGGATTNTSVMPLLSTWYPPTSQADLTAGRSLTIHQCSCVICRPTCR